MALWLEDSSSLHTTHLFLLCLASRARPPSPALCTQPRHPEQQIKVESRVGILDPLLTHMGQKGDDFQVRFLSLICVCFPITYIHILNLSVFIFYFNTVNGVELLLWANI